MMTTMSTTTAVPVLTVFIRHMLRVWFPVVLLSAVRVETSMIMESATLPRTDLNPKSWTREP